MKAPGFWTRDTMLARALSPLGALYALAGRARRAFARPWRAPVPVICVGNLTLGGAGKTPVAIDLARRLAARGVAVHAVTRGYGGTEKGPYRIDVRNDGPGRVGDEPLLLAAHVPTWVSRDRAAGMRAAVAAGAGALVADDGFQNPGFAKDLSVVVIDGGAGVGNGRVFPAGPLREPVARGLARADAVVVMGEGGASVPAFAGPVLRAHLAPRLSGMSLEGMRVLAFAGIGRPEKFFATVRAMGAEVVDRESFPDHHRYTGAMVNRLIARAEEQGLTPVTTEKDMVKMPPSARGRIWPVPVDVVWEDEGAVEALLDGVSGMVPPRP